MIPANQLTSLPIIESNSIPANQHLERVSKKTASIANAQANLEQNAFAAQGENEPLVSLADLLKAADTFLENDRISIDHDVLGSEEITQGYYPAAVTAEKLETSKQERARKIQRTRLLCCCCLHLMGCVSSLRRSIKNCLPSR